MRLVRTAGALWMCWVVSGCATTSPALAPTVAASKRIEERPLPPDPASEPLAGGFAKGDWVEPLEPGSCLDKAGKATAPGPCPSKSGLLTSEERAARDILFRNRYTELRRLYEADRQVWGAHRELYEERLKLADDALKNAQPNWWDRHALELGLVGGLVIGVGMTVGLVYALSPATKSP